MFYGSEIAFVLLLLTHSQTNHFSPLYLASVYHHVCMSVFLSFFLVRIVDSLTLHNNSLVGSIPEELYSLTMLGTLFADRNELTGTISGSGLRKWAPNMKRLSLFDNRFSGRIPGQFGRLTNLQVLRLSLNDLTGRIPASMCNLDIGVLTADCLTNQVHCTCCSACCNSLDRTCVQN